MHATAASGAPAVSESIDGGPKGALRNNSPYLQQRNTHTNEYKHSKMRKDFEYDE
jgi:hypothetical protein